MKPFLDSTPSRRALLLSALSSALLPCPPAALAQSAQQSFEQWVIAFRARALKRGISETTYNRVMGKLKPDLGVLVLQRSQPEFREQLWQYLNRRVSDWRIQTGKAKLREVRTLLARLEKDFGVAPSILLGLWGM